MALTLPQPIMRTFKGDILEYCDFICSFEYLVEEKNAKSQSLPVLLDTVYLWFSTRPYEGLFINEPEPRLLLGLLGKLDDPENLKKIINRLPFGMRLKWRDAVDRIVKKEGRDVTITDVTEFVTATTRAATHPIFGKVINEHKNKQDENKGKRHTGSRASGSVTKGDMVVVAMHFPPGSAGSHLASGFPHELCNYGRH